MQSVPDVPALPLGKLDHEIEALESSPKTV